LLSLAFFACKKDEDSTPTPTVEIIPGQGLKDVKIGDTAQKAFDIYGSVADSYFEIAGQYFHYLLYLGKGITVNLEPTTSETLNLNTKINDFQLSAPFSGKSDKNIGIGSTRSEVKTAYGDPNNSFGDVDIYTIGISFAYENDKVVEIYIEKPQ
jgi:hypothetical protein